MIIYRLNNSFQRVEVIEDFISALWTERYTPNGEVRMVVPDSPENRLRLREGDRLSLQGSDEIMLIDSTLIEDGTITYVGRTLETFFNERYFRNNATVSIQEWKTTAKPGAILSQMVQDIVINATSPGLSSLGGAANAIAGIFLGEIDLTDPISSRTVPFGPLYDVMLPVAESAKLGMKLKLTYADAFGFGLDFTVYRGLDRTSDQLDRETVRFSPAQDTMTGVKEARSIAGFKNVVYLYPPDWSSGSAIRVAYAPGYDATVTGFDRRMLVAQASDIQADQITGGVTLTQLMDQAAVNLLANNNYAKLVDGEIVPQPNFLYGQNYALGDIIELAADEFTVQKAMITEYIRSADATGERAYPTVTVLS